MGTKGTEDRDGCARQVYEQLFMGAGGGEHRNRYGCLILGKPYTGMEGAGSGAASPDPPEKKRRSARDQALSLLEYADRTERELVQKLRERGYAWEEIQDAVAFLLEYRYLDDQAYAQRYVRARSARKSCRQLQAELEQKGIARELIETALEEETVDEEGQIRRFLEKKGCRPGEALEPQMLRRITAALARKGFSYDQIRSVMEL